MYVGGTPLRNVRDYRAPVGIIPAKFRDVGRQESPVVEDSVASSDRDAVRGSNSRGGKQSDGERTRNSPRMDQDFQDAARDFTDSEYTNRQGRS